MPTDRVAIRPVEGLRRVRRLKAGEGRTLLLPPFATDLLRRRRPGATPYTSLFPDSLGGWRDPSNTSRDFREARDAAGLSARAVADQLGHGRCTRRTRRGGINAGLHRRSV